MNSMTGFGRGAAVVEGRRIVVEIRSVNHRGLDVKVRARILSAPAEIEVIRALRAGCARGSVQVAVEEEGGEGDAVLSDLSPERLRALAARLEAVRSSLGLSGVIDLATLAAFVRLERERGGGPVALDWAAVKPAFDEALAGLTAARAQEGAALAEDLRGRAAKLGAIVADIRTRIPVGRERALARLGERLTVALSALRQVPEGAAFDAGRLAQEAAVLADRLDVSEELARLGAHLDRLDELVGGRVPKGTAGASNEGVGRPLEFLLQEVGRELNTLGTKAQDVEISTLVIAAKAELEKIREQAQNIE